MEDVGAVVVQGGLAVAVAQLDSQRQCLLGQGQGLGQLTAVRAGQGQVVERGDAAARVGQGLGDGQAAFEVRGRGGVIAPAARQDAQDVVRLGRAATVIR